jgi:hypothetical protein
MLCDFITCEHQLEAIMFFDLFKKKEPPILKAEMLEPVNAPIATAEAKRIFKEWMLRIGHLSNKDKLDKMELADSVSYFVEEMKQHEQALKDDLADAKAQTAEEIKELKAELRELKKALVKCADQAEKQTLETEIAETEKDIQIAAQNVPVEVELLEKFKADKRMFLVDYINTQVHGGDWRSKR